MVTSTAAPIATGWSNKLPGGTCPTERPRLGTAHKGEIVNLEWTGYFSLDAPTLDQDHIVAMPRGAMTPVIPVYCPTTCSISFSGRRSMSRTSAYWDVSPQEGGGIRNDRIKDRSAQSMAGQCVV